MFPVLRVAVLASSLVGGVLAADTLRWNIPAPLRSALDHKSFATVFEVGSWINPFYLRGDFDGDGKPDYAFLISRRNDGKKGIGVWLSSKASMAPLIIGAGTKSRTGAGAADNWDFFDAWQVYGRMKIERGVGEGPPPTLLGEAILVERSESATGLVYWDGKRFRWYQQGD